VNGSDFRAGQSTKGDIRMSERENWSGRAVFIMAAVGSAIGFGNMWRFPFVCAKNGGGAFLIPYFVALISAGIPIMILEYYLGIRHRVSAPFALGTIKPIFKIVGWLAILGAFTLNIFYNAIMGWTFIHLFKVSTITEWAADIKIAEAHFFGEILGIPATQGNPWNFVGIQWPLFLGLIISWLIIWWIVKGGLNRVGKVLLYTVPLPVIFVIIMVIRGITLPGAVEGLNYYLTPDWSKLLEAKVWLAAYGQIFFSLSICLGTLVAYSSFMPKDTEIPNSAAITSFCNCTFSFLAGFAIFSILGFFAYTLNVPITEVAKAGPGLTFVAYPAAMVQLPFGVQFFAYLFYITLFLLGIDSAFSLLETIVAALKDKFGWTRLKATTLVAIISIILGIPFVTNAGLLWLDIVDHFAINYILVIGGIFECIALAYYFGGDKLIKDINTNAELQLGKLFKLCIYFLAPGILTVIVIKSIIEEVQKPYEGYPVSALLVIGLGSFLLCLIGAIVLSSTKSDKEVKISTDDKISPVTVTSEVETR
jgi:NSS family neurotransmitter:Na+ symporter